MGLRVRSTICARPLTYSLVTATTLPSGRRPARVPRPGPTTGERPGAEAFRAGSHPFARTCTWKCALSPAALMFESPTSVTLPRVERELGLVSSFHVKTCELPGNGSLSSPWLAPIVRS